MHRLFLNGNVASFGKKKELQAMVNWYKEEWTEKRLHMGNQKIKPKAEWGIPNTLISSIVSILSLKFVPVLSPASAYEGSYMPLYGVIKKSIQNWACEKKPVNIRKTL